MKRLITWLMLAFLAVVLVGTLTRTAMLFYSLRSQANSAVVQDSLADARAIADWARQRWDRPPADIRIGLGSLARVADARVWLVDATGNVRVDTDARPSWEGTNVSSPEFQQAMRGTERLMEGRSPWLESALAWVVPITENGRPIGVVFLFLPASALGNSGAGNSLLWSAMAALALATVVAYLISQRIARPVEQITRFAGELGRGNFGASIAVAGFAEMTELADTLSLVSRQLHSSFAALAEERQRLAGVLQSMQDGVIAINSRREVTLLNNAAIRLLELKAPGELPVPLQDLDVPPQLEAALTRAACGAAAWTNLRGGRGTELHAACHPVNSEGDAGGAVAVVQDLSALMQLQRMRENLVADVAHELRGPLANVSIMAEGLADGTIPWQKRRTYLQALRQEVDWLHRLSGEVLDLARIDAGTLVLHPEAVNLARLAEGVCARFRDRLAGSGVTLAVQVPDGLQATVSQVRMEQVLYNLVDNAIRHSAGGGKVLVHAGPAGEYIRLAVADTGSGIPPEHLPHIFERFYKVDPARTRSGAGTGLGLAVVRQLVELQGGSVSVESQEGKGTVFTLFLRPFICENSSV